MKEGGLWQFMVLEVHSLRSCDPISLASDEGRGLQWESMCGRMITG